MLPRNLWITLLIQTKPVTGKVRIGVLHRKSGHRHFIFLI